MTFITSNLVIAGLSDKTSFVSASIFTSLQCASESFYTYEKYSGQLIGQNINNNFIYGVQKDILFWVNDSKNGGDGKMYLSGLSSTDLKYISSSIDEKHLIFYYLKELYSDASSIPPNNVTNISDPIGTCNVFNIRNYTSSLFTYDYFDGKTATLWIPGLYTSSLASSSLIVSSSGSIISAIFNLPTLGTYAWRVKTFNQFTNTCSVELSYAETVPGVQTYNTFALTNYYNDKVLFVTASMFTTSSLTGYPIFAESALYSSSYAGLSNAIPIYFKNDNQNYGIFDVTGSYMAHFRPGMTINVGGFDVIINGSQYGTESIFILTPASSATFPPNHVTRVYTMSNPFNGTANKNVYAPINISFGNKSYLLGHKLISQTDNQLIAGTYNQTGSYDKLFIVGNGYAENNRKDAFAINTQGVTILGSTNAIIPTTVLGGIYFDGTDFYLGM